MAKDKKSVEVKDATEPVVIPIRISPAMKAALDTYAEEHKVTVAGMARKLIAAEIGYDLSGEPEPQRKSKYTTELDKVVGRLVSALKVKTRNDSMLRAMTLRIEADAEADKAKADIMRAEAADLDTVVRAILMNTWEPTEAELADLRSKAEAELAKTSKETPTTTTDDAPKS